jgi:hypothetical protein
MLDRVQVQALAGPLKDIQRHSCILLAVCLGLLSCWKVNLHPSLLWRRFSLRFSLYYYLFIFPSIMTSHRVPAAEKQPQSMMLPPPWFIVGMVPGSLQTWCLASGQRVQSWFHQTRESDSSWFESPLDSGVKSTQLSYLSNSKDTFTENDSKWKSPSKILLEWKSKIIYLSIKSKCNLKNIV